MKSFLKFNVVLFMILVTWIFLLPEKLHAARIVSNEKITLKDDNTRPTYMKVRYAPLNGLIRINLDQEMLEEHSEVQIHFYSLIGEKIKSISTSESALLISTFSWNKGYYISKLSVNGKVLEAKKFVVG